MFSCNAVLKMLSKSTSLQTRTTTKVLPYRRPVQVLTKKQYQEYLKSQTKKKSKKILKVPKVSENAVIKAARKTKPSEDKPNFDLRQLKYKKLRDLPGNVVGRMLYDIGSAKNRPNPYLCLLSNVHLINEARNAGDFVRNIYFTHLDNLEVFPVSFLRTVRLTHVPFRILKMLPKSCSEGLFAVAATQDVKLRKKVSEKRGLADRKRLLKLLQITLICDSIEDKEEMGKVLKFAEEYGCLQAFIMSNCVDVWNADVIRAAEGAHFKIPIVTGLSWDELSKYGINFYAVHPSETGVTLQNFVSSETLKKYEKSSQIFDLLNSESSLGTLSKSEEGDFHMPAIAGNQANLKRPGMLLLGQLSQEAFYYAAQQKFSNSFVLNIPPNSSKTAADQIEYIFENVEKERKDNKNNENKTNKIPVITEEDFKTKDDDEFMRN